METLTVSVPEAAKILGIGRNLAYGLVANGALPHLRLGRRLVVPRQALERLLTTAGQVQQPAAPAGE